jgi:hypothetical protein
MEDSARKRRPRATWQETAGTGRTDGRLADEARHLVRVLGSTAPGCLGLSLTVFSKGEATFTAVASCEDMALIDALQYLGGGPGMEVRQVGAQVHVPDLRGEGGSRWPLLQEGAEATKVRSVLSLPVRQQGRVAASLNLFGLLPTSLDPFTGAAAPSRLVEWAEQVVEQSAFEAPEEDRSAEPEAAEASAREAVDEAARALASRWDTDIETARDRLGRAALAAGADLAQLAGLVTSTDLSTRG